jgi:ATP-dependent protease ClpP protease subunit
MAFIINKNKTDINSINPINNNFSPSFGNINNKSNIDFNKIIQNNFINNKLLDQEIPLKDFLDKNTIDAWPDDVLFPSFTVKILPNESGNLTVFIVIVGGIELFYFYRCIEMVLDRLTENDEVFFLINSQGGYVNGGCSLISAISRCKAEITTVGFGIIASMGSGIWLFGHNRIILPGTVIMFHMSSGGVAGNTTVNIESESSLQDYMTEVFMNKAQQDGILTPEEVVDIVKNKKDIFITYEEFSRRMGGNTENEGDE